MPARVRRLPFRLIALAACFVGLAGRARAARAGEAVPRQARLHADVGAAFGIAQDARGFLWLGTPSGLFRFDGLRFVLAHPTSARRVLVTRDEVVFAAKGSGLVESWEGGPWAVNWRVGEGGLLRLPARARSSASQDVTGLPSPWVWSLAEGGDGRVWVGTERGLAVIARGGTVATAVDPGGPSGIIHALHIDAHGDVFVGADTGLVVLREGNSARRERVEIGGPVASIAPERAGGLWVATRHAIIKLSSDRKVLRTLPFESGHPSEVLEDRDGVVWAAGAGRLVRLDPSATAFADVKGLPELPDAHVTALAEDREGSVWVGLRGAASLLQLAPSSVRNFASAEGFAGEAAFAVLVARDGNVVASGSGGVTRIGPEGIRSLVGGREFPDFAPRALTETNDGRILVATERSIVEIDGWRSAHTVGATAKSLRPPRAQRGDHAVDVRVDRDGALWVLWAGGAVERHEGARPTGDGEVVPVDPACAGEPRFLHVGAEGAPWLVLSGGRVARLEDSLRFACVSTTWTSGREIDAIADVDPRTMWIASWGEPPLLRVRDGRVAALPSELAPSVRQTVGLVRDRDQLWMTTRNGVARAALADLDAAVEGRIVRLPVRVYDVHDGMRSAEAIARFRPSAAVDPQGTLWVPTLRGLSALSPPEKVQLPQPVPTIDEVLVDGRARDVPGERSIEVPPGTRDLELRFAAPSFVAPSRPSVSYALVGLDRVWVDAGPGRSARIARLPPGRYDLRVRLGGAGDAVARSLDRAQAGLVLHVLPAWHETWWFRMAVVLAGLGALVGAIVLRGARLRARYAALEAERARIAADLHDGLAQGFLGVRLLLDSLRMGLSPTRRAPDGELERLAREAGEALEDTRTEARRAIWDIRSAALDRQPLGRRLEAVVADARRRTSSEVTLELASTLPRSSQLEREVPALVTEAITNAVRHGGAKRIGVRIDADVAGLRVRILDDGRGLPGGVVPPGGFGVLGMRERATRLGGTLAVRNAGPDGGVEVMLEISPDRFAALKDDRP